MAMRTPDCHSNVRRGARWAAVALAIPIAAAACGSAGRRGDQAGAARVPLKLLAAGATEAAMRDQIGAFQAQTGLAVDITFGAVGALRDQVIAGAPADVVIVTPAIITTLDAEHRVHAGSRVDLGRIGGGIAVKTGTPAPAIATAEQLKQALLEADEVYYADPATATAGAAFMKVVDALGIGDQVRSKGHTAPGGKEAMRNLARGDAAHAIGVTQVSEILSVPEVMLVGEYPGALQVKTTYAAIILERTTRLDDARTLVQFLAGPAFQARLARSGFEPVVAEPRRTPPNPP